LYTVVNFRIAVNCRNFKVQELVNSVAGAVMRKLWGMETISEIPGEVVTLW
jgi:hypothetical protein